MQLKIHQQRTGIMNNKDARIPDNLKPEIRLLIEIQNLDKEIRTCKSTIKTYPAQFEEIEKTFQEHCRQLDVIKQRRDAMIKKHHAMELDLKDYEEKKNKFLSHQFDVETNKEMQALQHEIDMVSEKIDKTEDGILSLLEDEESLKEQIEQMKTIVAAEEQAAAIHKQELQEELNNLKKKCQELMDKRDALLIDLPDPVKEFYDEVHTRYVGDIVVPVISGSCSGCFMQLLPQRLVQVHIGKEIVYCDRCLRILAYDVDYDPNNPPIYEELE